MAINKSPADAAQVTFTSITYVGPAIQMAIYPYCLTQDNQVILGSSGALVSMPACANPTTVPLNPPVVVSLSSVNPAYRGPLFGQTAFYNPADQSEQYGLINSGQVYTIVDPTSPPPIVPLNAQVSSIQANWT